MKLFRDLSSDEEREFRQWAISQWAPGRKANQLWHPVVRDEWARLDAEFEAENDVEDAAYLAGDI